MSGPADKKPAASSAPPAFGRGPIGFGSPPAKSKNFKASGRRLIARLAPHKVGLLAVMAFALISTMLAVNGPRILSHATNLIYAGSEGASLSQYHSKAEAVAALHAQHDDNRAARIEAMDVVPGQGIDYGALAKILGGVLLLYVFASLFAWLQSYVLNIVVQRAVRKLRWEAQDKMSRLPLAYFDSHPHGELLSRVTNDIDNIAQALGQTLGQILGSLLIVTGILVMLVVISPLLALISLVTVPLSVFVTARIAKRSQKRFVDQWKHVGALNGQIEEAFTGHSLVKVLGRTREVETRFAAKNAELYDASFRAQFISSIIMPAISFIGNLTYVGIAVVGGIRVATGAMLIGSIQAFIQYTRQFSQQLSQLASMANVLQSGVASAERVFELFDSPDQAPDHAPAAPLAAVRGEVRFEDVSFRYKPEQPVIEHLSLVVQPGQTVAIVGPTGAGKTTLVNLIMRFYELDSGRILIDGTDIATVTRDDLRERIGMVLQDTWLFGGTIRDNIRYGHPEATDDQLIAAAKATYVDRFVRALPAGYDTVINDEGNNISSGEKQLITIARAFLADPSILILDEATSSVDTRTEVLVQHAMAALRSARTSFVIAHRLSTIRDANVILVMDGGHIVEHGTHAELLAADGKYAALYAAQFARSHVSQRAAG